MILNIKKVSVYKCLVYILLLDLVLGGAGRLVVFGPISFRYLLFFLVVAFEIILLKDYYAWFNISYFSVFLFLSYLTLSALISLTINPVSNVVDEFFGYLPLLLTPFFGYGFTYGLIKVENIKRLFLLSCFILSVFSILLWAYSFIRGVSAYQIIEIGFLRRFSMGSLAISGGFVRLFMKGTIFCAIATVMCFNQWLRADGGITNMINMIVCALAVILSFTLGLYVAVAVGLMFSLLSVNQNQRITRIFIILIVSVVLVLIVALKFRVYDMMVERFSGDYTLAYKFIQTDSLIDDFIGSPIFGNGVGHVVSIDYGYMTNTGFRTENMWGELLNHYGLLGFSFFFIMIISTCINLWNKSKIVNNPTYLMFGIGLLVIAIESLSNPFLNNAIGLTFTSLCIGMTQADYYKTNN